MSGINIIEALKVQPLSEEEKERRHILKRLSGPIASCKESTRNGRHYNKELWQKALNDEIFKEKIKTKSLFLELGHPRDRSETDMTCVCACIPEMPKIIGDDLYAVVDVLDTANGRLLNTLIDYGFVPGISSRGEGDMIGNEVDPETFFLETFDVVQVPALTKARLSMVESLNKNNSLKLALNEALEKSTVDERKIMESALNHLDISLEPTDQKVENIDVEPKSFAADNDGAQVIKELQESLKKNREYEGTIKTLQENLSVCYTKEKELEEQLSKFKGKLQTIQETANRANALNVRIKTLSEQLQKQQEQNQILKDRNSKLQEGLLRTRNSGKELNNTLTEQYDKVNRLTEQINNLNNLVEKTRLDCDKREQSLREQIEDMKKDSSIKTSEYRTKLSSANKLVEKYQRIARLAVDKYIGSMATKLGVNPSEIKNRLKENYSFEDIDKVCEDLKNYRLRVSNLPFELQESMRQGKVKVTQEKKDPIIPESGLDDNVDEWLKSLV